MATAVATPATDVFKLSPEEIRRFHQQGYLGPYALWTPAEMAEIRKRIETEVLTRDGPNPRNRLQCRHLDSRVVYYLCSHPAIVQRMKALFGRDLILWASYFFNKEPGGIEIPWHQDINYWPIEPALNISAWLVFVVAGVVDAGRAGSATPPTRTWMDAGHAFPHGRIAVWRSRAESRRSGVLAGN